ncbi:hypothetical protein [Allonocardiopsis opalescens]|uniref:Uncharacterized protein n=1 Tax=Allonocardiopsis opalescens TaxID=1144618 RepID=A0A2T0PSQ6_9ACTN|nr:hypothetical protein [Allonocardiopsis opalescens]PRX91937.1 hypothetical protein CLV72_11210 [Allonocardiopsis opalescens]
MSHVHVHRPITGRIHLDMPYHPRNRDWLKSVLGAHSRPAWNRPARRWEIARPHLRTLVEALAHKFGSVDVIVDVRATRHCDTRCQEATGDECTCRCLGDNHGGAAYRKAWLLVGDTTLVAADGSVRRRFRVEST